MVKAANEKDAIARTEAALYSSGRPLKIDEIIRASGTESRIKTKQILDDLVKKTKSAFKAIEIAILPDGSYVFQLKPEYSGSVRKYASKPILPKATLKTLSYIAYTQPVSSKNLVDTRGNGVYSHLKELRLYYTQVYTPPSQKYEIKISKTIVNLAIIQLDSWMIQAVYMQYMIESLT